MRIAPVISLVLSVIVGLAAVFFGRSWINNEADATDTPAVIIQEVLTQSLLVVDAPIARGDLLTEASFRKVDWPLAHAPEGAVTDIKSILTEQGEFPFALGVMVPGEPLLTGKLSHTAVRDTLAGLIEPGFRAVSVEVTDASGVAGFILPDTHVDVNVFYEVENAGTGRLTQRARTLIEDVRVLAVDQSFSVNLEGAAPANTVTLQVTPSQAKAVGLAAQTSEIGLVLRPKGEETLEAPKPRRVVRRTPVQAVPVKRFTPIRVIQGEAEETVSAPIAPTGNGVSNP